MAAARSQPFGFGLILSSGDALGAVVSVGRQARPGDTIVVSGLRYQVKSVIPVERIAEFVDAAENGLLEVEPL